MGSEFEIALVLLTALLWIGITLAILSGIDRPERKARRRANRAARQARHQDRHPRIRKLGAH